MIFQTLFEVEELGDNCKIFICDEWLLTDVNTLSKWVRKQDPEQPTTSSLNLSDTTVVCVECGTTKDVMFSPYDFFPHCEKHRPLVDSDEVIKTSLNMNKNL